VSSADKLVSGAKIPEEDFVSFLTAFGGEGSGTSIVHLFCIGYAHLMDKDDSTCVDKLLLRCSERCPALLLAPDGLGSSPLLACCRAAGSKKYGFNLIQSLLRFPCVRDSIQRNVNGQSPLDLLLTHGSIPRQVLVDMAGSASLGHQLLAAIKSSPTRNRQQLMLALRYLPTKSPAFCWIAQEAPESVLYWMWSKKWSDKLICDCVELPVVRVSINREFGGEQREPALCCMVGLEVTESSIGPIMAIVQQGGDILATLRTGDPETVLERISRYQGPQSKGLVSSLLDKAVDSWRNSNRRSACFASKLFETMNSPRMEPAPRDLIYNKLLVVLSTVKVSVNAPSHCFIGVCVALW
jgi:hypothetical protein